ncbi:hypothetical protein LABF186_19840 [Lactobacillus amylovorus subsp. animalium]|nr:MAE_28990/MAE_18760 family HEPN-like nuclease [Lactobacillus gallinarum]GMM14865.1 hypothetical protein LABF186_19840 [Lactobacillus amylovorus]GMM15055.1 hypothetical protein LABF125_01880 [Lactobacillus amylovorus]
MELDKFNTRVSELRFYIRTLIKLNKIINIETDNKYGDYLRKQLNNLEKKHYASDIIPILRSNAFMMMYNLIEDTIRSLITQVYRQINMEDLTYEDLNQNYQKLIRQYRFKGSSGDKIKRESAELIDDILNKQKVNLDIKSFSLSGNADYKNIERIFEKHSMKIKFAEKNYNKYHTELYKIKNTRNSLAHGNTSFIDGTRGISIEDTEKYAEDIVKFLRYMIRKTDKLIKKRGYSVIK